MNNAGKSNEERIVAYAVQNGQTPSLTVAGMKLAFTVKFHASPESEVWLLRNSEIEIIFQYSRTIFTSISYFLFRSERKKLPYHYRSRSSTVKAISDFLVTIYKFYPRHTVPTDQRLNTDFNNTRIERGKISHLQVACSLSRNEREKNSETRANSLTLISLWSYLKEEKRQSEIFTGNLVVSASGHNQEASHNAQFSLFEIFLSFIPSHLCNLERFCHSGW